LSEWLGFTFTEDEILETVFEAHMPDEVQAAYDKAGELLRRHGA
jgi:hypothetical protein